MIEYNSRVVTNKIRRAWHSLRTLDTIFASMGVNRQGLRRYQSSTLLQDMQGGSANDHQIASVIGINGIDSRSGDIPLSSPIDQVHSYLVIREPGPLGFGHPLRLRESDQSKTHGFAFQQIPDLDRRDLTGILDFFDNSILSLEKMTLNENGHASLARSVTLPSGVKISFYGFRSQDSEKPQVGLFYKCYPLANTLIFKSNSIVPIDLRFLLVELIKDNIDVFKEFYGASSGRVNNRLPIWHHLLSLKRAIEILPPSDPMDIFKTVLPARVIRSTKFDEELGMDAQHDAIRSLSELFPQAIIDDMHFKRPLSLVEQAKTYSFASRLIIDDNLLKNLFPCYTLEIEQEENGHWEVSFRLNSSSLARLGQDSDQLAIVLPPRIVNLFAMSREVDGTRVVDSKARTFDTFKELFNSALQKRIENIRTGKIDLAWT